MRLIEAGESDDKADERIVDLSAEREALSAHQERELVVVDVGRI